MAIVYNWVISAMDEYPTTPNGLDDVVFTIHWRRNATEVVGENTYFADVYSTLSVPAPNPDDFTPYEQLKFEQVCAWLEAGLDVEAIDASLAEQIEEKKHPKVVSLPLPWDVTTTTSTTTVVV